MSCEGCGYLFRVVDGRLVGARSSQSRQHGRSSDQMAGVASNDSGATWAMTVGAMTTITIAFLMGFFERGVGTALVSASIGGIAAGVWLKRQMSPVVSVRYLTSETRAAFLSADQLLKARETLVQSRNGYASALKSKQDLRRRLTSLRDRMRALALPAYAPRIISINAGLVTLDKQIAMDTRLRDGYDKSTKMIEIELEAGAAADHMNEDVSIAIAEAMHELQELEASQAELGRQLEANIEVEQLLRVRTG